MNYVKCQDLTPYLLPPYLLPYLPCVNVFSVILITSIYLSLLFNYIEVSAQTLSDKILINNFEKSKNDHSLNADFGAFADNKNLGYCYLFYVKNTQQEILKGNEYSLQIKWDITKKGAYGGCWADLKHLNLESFNYLTFYVKGLKGGENFKIGLRGRSDAPSETKFLINEVLSKGVTTEWQKVVIPLKQFKDIQDWSDVNIFSISFEHTFESGKGAILIDEIAFEK